MASTSSLLNFLSPFFPSNTTPQLHHHHHHNNIPKFPNQNSLPSSPNSSLSISSPQTQEHKPIIGKKEYPSELMAVVCPSLAYSNTLFFDSPYNVQIMVDENEPEDRFLGRFRREVIRAGIFKEIRRCRHHENSRDKAKRKAREAAKLRSRLRRGFRPREPFQKREEITMVEKKDDDEDNWEMAEGDSPF